MTQRLRSTLEWVLVDTHLWVATAAASLTVFAAAAVGAPVQLPPLGVVFSSTLLIYAVDDIFDGRMRSQPVRWLAVGSGALSLLVQLLWAPRLVVIVVIVGALPGLLYGVRICGRRLRELPGVKPFFVAGSLAVAVVAVPVLWGRPMAAPSPGLARMAIAIGSLFLLVLSNVCFFDLRDRAADARAGVRTIPVRLGVVGTRRFCLTLSLAVGLATPFVGDDLRGPLLMAVLATAAYTALLPAPGGRLQYALAVDGVPVLLGLSVLAL
jgi:hypothetical protein